VGLGVTFNMGEDKREFKNIDFPLLNSPTTATMKAREISVTMSEISEIRDDEYLVAIASVSRDLRRRGSSSSVSEHQESR
jgi:hypothetical protein